MWTCVKAVHEVLKGEKAIQVTLDQLGPQANTESMDEMEKMVSRVQKAQRELMELEDQLVSLVLLVLLAPLVLMGTMVWWVLTVGTVLASLTHKLTLMVVSRFTSQTGLKLTQVESLVTSCHSRLRTSATVVLEVVTGLRTLRTFRNR
jgi:uncharacterized membrane protein YecN with MAPEG domain